MITTSVPLLAGGSTETAPNISGVLAIAINMYPEHPAWYDGSALIQIILHLT